MTCLYARSHLDDFLDDDIAAADALRVKEHLEACPDCRAELEEGRLLRTLLSQQPPVDPGPRYWSEVTPLIMARTVESDAPAPERVSVDEIVRYRGTRLVRSVVTLAASLVLLYVALTLGSGHRAAMAKQTASPRPVFLAASLTGLTGPDNFAIVTPQEQADMARITAVMGAPGILGRFTVLPGLLSFE